MNIAKSACVACRKFVESGLNNLTIGSTARVTQSEEAVCSLCFGVLQVSDMSGIVAKAKNVMAEYEGIKSFMCSIRFSPCLLLRSQLLSKLCAEKEKDLASAIKEQLRKRLNSEIELGTGVKYDLKSPFFINVEVECPESLRDYATFKPQLGFPMYNPNKRKRNGNLANSGVFPAKKVMEAIEKAEEQTIKDLLPFTVPAERATISVTGGLHSELFIGGRYCKLKRHISHSPWIVDGQRKTDFSVEELVYSGIVDYFKAQGYKFASSGREDADVRTLGTGRPFYFELKNPKRVNASPEQIIEIEKKINDSAKGLVQVRDLQMVSREQVKQLNASVTEKSKSYRLLVQVPQFSLEDTLEQVNSKAPFDLEQRNPSRVPRRADLTRHKQILELKVRPASDQDIAECFSGGVPVPVRSETAPFIEEKESIKLIVDVKTTAGTYVKEFVHGDEGRTKPALYELLGASCATVLSLDVTQIHSEWP